MPRVTELHVNGQTRSVNVDTGRTLLSVLRDDLGLTGCKYACGEGQCAACSVLVDGVTLHSCKTPVGTVRNKQITTIESLEQNGRLHPLQQAFIDAGAMQCAYCTSGMILGGYALLKKNPNPSEAEIIRGMNGHLCRCGAYQRIIAAIQQAAKVMLAEAK
jgi:aerobic-type carbon monoxide dehydrogenase small subunit (CoxS/CutS family)